MKGVFVGKNTVRDLREFDVPSPGQGEILVKNVAVSSNPKDWKIPDWTGKESIEGNDIAGYVEAVGEGVTKFKKGDKVASFSIMATDIKYGAYAEYTVAPSATSFHLTDKVEFETAAALPLAYITAVIGLHLRLGLPEPSSSASSTSDALCVYGAATTVGVYVTQLAKMAGLTVVGVAGSSIDVAKSYGCDEVIDYRGKSIEQLGDEILNAAGGRVRYVYDAVSEHGSPEASILALGKNGGGKYTHVLPLSDEVRNDLPSGVTLHHTVCDTAYGKDQAHCEKYFDLLGEWLDQGKFRSQRVEVVPGGLEGVKDGLRMLQDGKVNGKKLVYRVAETPALQK
ncbi:hypothetical protein JCM10212_003676 [Sporobolomyces blumeae]